MDRHATNKEMGALTREVSEICGNRHYNDLLYARNCNYGGKCIKDTSKDRVPGNGTGSELAKKSSSTDCLYPGLAMI